MDPSAFLKGRTRETAIHRDRFGKWFNGEDPILHPKLVQSFDGWIDLAEDGRFCLSNDINWAYIEVEGPPYFVRAAKVQGEQISLALSGGRQEILDPSTLVQDEQGALYCRVREGRCLARFENPATMGLVDVLGEGDDGVFLQLGGQKIMPPTLDVDLDVDKLREIQ